MTSTAQTLSPFAYHKHAKRAWQWLQLLESLFVFSSRSKIVPRTPTNILIIRMTLLERLFYQSNRAKRLDFFIGKKQTEYNHARREVRAKGSQLCEECGHKTKHENWDAHFDSALHSNPELNVLMKGYSRRLGNLRQEGKLNDDIQAEIRQNTRSRKRKYANDETNNFLINLLMTNHNVSPRHLNPILIKCLITFINYR